MIPIQDTVPTRNPPLAVYTLIALNVLAFALELTLPEGEIDRLFYIVVMVPIFFYPLFFVVPAVMYLLFWILSQVYSGALTLAGPGEVGGVAWWAHIGGFLAGLVLHPLFLQPRRAIRPWQLDEYGVEG